MQPNEPVQSGPVTTWAAMMQPIYALWAQNDAHEPEPPEDDPEMCNWLGEW